MDRRQYKFSPATLVFYAYALTLGAIVIGQDVSVEGGITRATAIGTIAWLMVNRRRLDED